MLPTFVIGLREGLEAALIVGIIAAFLRSQGRRDLVRWVFAGVAGAVLLCVAVGIGLHVYSRSLPHEQQEGLETVIGLLAVAMVTYMVVWMRRNSRGLKGELEGRAGGALAAGGVGRALVLMAFLAVIREGSETVVFLIAAFNESRSGAAAPVGALVGLLVAVALGYGIYRGGVRLNLSKFFRATGVVLVLVAAGLVVNALHTAHEAGWLNIGRQPTVDLSWLVQPGSVQASLLTGMLGIQPRPVLVEVMGWLLYLVPVACYVLWRPGPAAARRSLLTGGGVAVAASLVAALLAPAGSVAGEEPEALPAGQPIGDARTANVTITAAHGCVSDRRDFAAGGVTFKVVNLDATAVTEVELLHGQRIVAEKENLPPGLSGQFAVTVGAGEYTLYCPGATPERSRITVTGAAAPRSALAAELDAATARYATWVRARVGNLLATSRTLDTALHGTDLAAAQRAYIAARPYYELIEPVAESFTVGTDSIDADLDARENDVPGEHWTGFHRIEKGLFADRSLRGLAAHGQRLVSDVLKLQRLCATLTFRATELANGAQELLDEVAAGKITGEEERYSHIDLLDIAYNTEGSRRAFAELAPVLRRIDAHLVTTIDARFDALDQLVGTFRDAADPSGYVRYGALSTQDKRDLAAAVKAVQEPLSTVASKVADQ